MAPEVHVAHVAQGLGESLLSLHYYYYTTITTLLLLLLLLLLLTFNY